MSGNHLLLIDPQNDFADAAGALCVPGAKEDMERVAALIERSGSEFESIHVTLDSHQLYHIANPLYWINKHGEHPAPFTRISLNDIENGNWSPADGLKEKAMAYVSKLEADGRYPHTIWPPHCIIGEWGHGLFPVVAKAFRNWVSGLHLVDPVIDYVLKGSNPHTEHFSAMRAEVPNQDPSTKMNQSLLTELRIAKQIIVAGIAGSHCVANTVRDLAAELATVSNIVLLTDTMSPVVGCEKLQEDFLAEMKSRGMKLSTTDSLSL